MDLENNHTVLDYFQTSTEYIDFDYSTWIWYISKCWAIMFFLPFLSIGATGLILYIFKFLRHVTRGLVDCDDTTYWNEVRKVMAAVWNVYARIVYGYEVIGIENIPKTGPALIIYYHGVLPLDLMYLTTLVLCSRDRFIHSVVDRFFFEKIYFRFGWGIILEVMKSTTGTVESCANVLKEGNLLSISPGGAYEALFSQDYELMWRNRVGFAKAAIDAKAPIIPMFTENIRETYRTFRPLHNVFIRLYESTRNLVVPFYGGFPVKLRTHLGPPIEYDPALTPEELQKKVALAIEDLKNKHQRNPASITHALLQRFPKTKKIE